MRSGCPKRLRWRRILSTRVGITRLTIFIRLAQRGSGVSLINPLIMQAQESLNPEDRVIPES